MKKRTTTASSYQAQSDPQLELVQPSEPSDHQEHDHVIPPRNQASSPEITPLFSPTSVLLYDPRDHSLLSPDTSGPTFDPDPDPLLYPAPDSIPHSPLAATPTNNTDNQSPKTVHWSLPQDQEQDQDHGQATTNMDTLLDLEFFDDPPVIPPRYPGRNRVRPCYYRREFDPAFADAFFAKNAS
jgi:hypothetical protein